MYWPLIGYWPGDLTAPDTETNCTGEPSLACVLNFSRIGNNKTSRLFSVKILLSSSSSKALELLLVLLGPDLLIVFSISDSSMPFCSSKLVIPTLSNTKIWSCIDRSGSSSLPLFSNTSINENWMTSISKRAFFSRTIIEYSRSAVLSKSRRTSEMISDTRIPLYQPYSPLRTTAPLIVTALVTASLNGNTLILSPSTKCVDNCF